jgi:hypothetical protein
VTKAHPFNPAKQVMLDHTDPNLGLSSPSAACVDFIAFAEVTVEGDRHVLNGVTPMGDPHPFRVDTTTFQAITLLFNKLWG